MGICECGFLWRRLNFGSHKNRRIGAVAGNWLAQTDAHSVAPSNGSKFLHAIITLFSHYKIIITIIIIIIIIIGNEKFGSGSRKTFDRFTTKDSYTWNITHNTESTAV